MNHKNWWWGQSSSIDLYECDKRLLKDPDEIRKFTRDLCKVLKMKRYGPTLVERFGEGKLEGYSMMQFIETSSVIAHFDEKADRAFIDVFSCKTYEPKEAAEFCKNFFKAKNFKIKTLTRK